MYKRHWCHEGCDRVLRNHFDTTEAVDNRQKVTGWRWQLLKGPCYRRGRFVATILRFTFGVFDTRFGRGGRERSIRSSRVRDHCVIAGTDNDNKRHGRRDLARRGCGRLPLMRTRRQAPKETERDDATKQRWKYTAADKTLRNGSSTLLRWLKGWNWSLGGKRSELICCSRINFGITDTKRGWFIEEFWKWMLWKKVEVVKNFDTEIVAEP